MHRPFWSSCRTMVSGGTVKFGESELAPDIPLQRICAAAPTCSWLGPGPVTLRIACARRGAAQVPGRIQKGLMLRLQLLPGIATNRYRAAIAMVILFAKIEISPSRLKAGKTEPQSQPWLPSWAHSSQSSGMPRSAMVVFTAEEPPTTRPRGKRSCRPAVGSLKAPIVFNIGIAVRVNKVSGRALQQRIIRTDSRRHTFKFTFTDSSGNSTAQLPAPTINTSNCSASTLLPCLPSVVATHTLALPAPLIQSKGPAR